MKQYPVVISGTNISHIFQSLTKLDYPVLSFTRVLDQARDGGEGIKQFRGPTGGNTGG